MSRSGPGEDGAATRAVVVVNYGSHALLEQSLPPLDLAALHARVVVVDNLSSAEERAAITTTCTAHGWDLVALDANTGFGHGVNAGVTRAAELGCTAYVMLNPDAYASTDALRALFRHVEREPMTLVSPTVLRGDGSVWFRGGTVDVEGGTTRSSTSVTGDDRAWLTGACLAVHAELWEAVGGFDPAYFLYWEDVDLSWRVRRVGGDVAVLSDVTVRHDVGGTQQATGGGRAKSPTYVYYNCRNRLLFAAGHLDRRAWLRWLRGSPAYAWEVLQRGGRRALAADARRLLWAAVAGTVAGAVAGVRARAAFESGPALPGGRDPRSPARRDARRTRYSRVRLYETVRTAHLERAHALTPASIVYGHRRYDFDDSLVQGLDLLQAGLLPTARLLWRSDVSAVEVNEPLMSSGLRRAAVAITVLRLRHRRARVVSYAIENKAPVSTGTGPRAVLHRLLELLLRRYVWHNLDRLAYGTEAARDLYATLLPRRSGLATRLFPAVPQPCGCGSLDGKDPNQVVFLGALVGRKGFPLLMEAWPLVREARLDARLRIVGKGELEAQARESAATDESVSLDVDPPRARIHDHLREAGVLVLPSQPAPTWREQVGLPIVEGLAHGCGIVTTTETGLASWLSQHGHEVLAAPGSPAELARRIVAALDARRPADSVLADLPAEDARLAADRWLFAEGSAGAGGRR